MIWKYKTPITNAAIHKPFIGESDSKFLRPVKPLIDQKLDQLISHRRYKWVFAPFY